MIDLSREFHPQPKPIRKVKAKKPLKPIGKKGKNWNDGRDKLKLKFFSWGITKCEVRLEGCLRDNFLGFAHKERRIELTQTEIIDPKFVVLACQPCHNTLDNEMSKGYSKSLMEAIIKDRKTL